MSLFSVLAIMLFQFAGSGSAAAVPGIPGAFTGVAPTGKGFQVSAWYPSGSKCKGPPIGYVFVLGLHNIHDMQSL
jgi:hypothetical protein